MNAETIEPIKAYVWNKIEGLAQLLRTNDPLIAGHIKEIHKNLIQYEELSHLLSDEQIRQLIVAQKNVTGTVLLQKVQKETKQSITKQAKNIRAEDL